MRARFWIYWNGGIVRIALRRGETVSLFAAHKHEEGFSSTEETYRLSGDSVSREIYTNSRDCDGPHSEHVREVCRLDRLAEVYNEYVRISYPAWETKRARQRDDYAERMGY